MKQLGVLGAGSWGTALAIALSGRFESVRLWARDVQQAADLQSDRENRRYLPGCRLPDSAWISCDIGAVAAGADVLLSAIPSAHLRHVLQSVRAHLSPQIVVVSATKGLEEGSLFRMSQVLDEVLGATLRTPIAVLSGPTFAKEVAAGEPAAVVIASEDKSVAETIQHAFSTPALRFYMSTDVIGVEIGAALKNVIAIAAGVCCGLGLGSNSVAALVTRGLAETTRLALSMGGKGRTLSGLAGLGDLVLTATGDLSRNRFVGLQLGRGRALNRILSEMTMVAEGVGTCRAARDLGIAHRVELPIVNKMFEVLYESKDPRQAIRELMERPLTSE